MIAALAKWIDWSALQLMTRRMPPANPNSRLEEAVEFLNGPEFISAESRLARVEFDDSLHFRFHTPRPCEFEENNIVYGRLFRCAEGGLQRPTIVLLHGWNSSASYRLRFPLIARRCNRVGINVATLEAPYHFRRRPRDPDAVRLDYLRLAERTAQAIAEIRALVGWLLEQGCPAVALWGSSYGGWLAGLTACREARLAAAVMAVPSVRGNRAHAKRVIWRQSREALQKQVEAFDILDKTWLNLTMSRPIIAKENILLIEAIHDLFAMKEPIEELWQLWGKPDIWRVPHGHFSFGLIGAPCLMMNRVLCWLKPRLERGAPQPGLV